MAEPTTVTGPPPSHGSPVVIDLARNGHAATGNTKTQPEDSTPAPAHPDRRTESGDTERVRPEPPDPNKLPDVPGFRVERVIGRGAMGVVYRVHDLTLDKTRAMKMVFLHGRDPQAVRVRFDREVQALAKIDHPNVVPVYQAGEWRGFPFFTMKYVPGGSLAGRLARFTGDPRACGALVAKIARGVQALHDHRIIHRDIKPLNILLGDGDEPLVADFGLAKWLDEPGYDGWSVSGAAVGTRPYMAPEQTRARSAEYSPACDIWAIGVTLYELLSGERPFAEDGANDLFRQIRTADPPPLPEGVPAELARVVSVCLAKCPGDRYATAGQLADDLEAWLATGRAREARRLSRRRRWRQLVVGAAVLLAAVATAAAILWPRAPRVEDIPVSPVSVVDHRSVEQRVKAGETVYITDDKGNPLFPTSVPRPGFELTRRDVKGYATFNSAMPGGMLRVLNEPFPRPAVIEGEIGVPVGDVIPQFSDGGFYVGEQLWSREEDWHRSAVRIVICPIWSEGQWHVRADASVYCWRGKEFLPVHHLGWVTRPWPREQKGKDFRFVPFAVHLSAREMQVTVNDAELFNGTIKKLDDDSVFKMLRRDAAPGEKLAGFTYSSPAFGHGIGLTARNSSVVVRNLRLSAPK